MKIYKNFNISKNFKNSAIAIGNFDGFHLGHQKVINTGKHIAKKNVDIKGIGFYSLGSHRKNISDEQKKEYIDLFEDYFLKTFSHRLAEYTHPKFKVESSKKLNEKYTIVSSILIATDKMKDEKFFV